MNDSRPSDVFAASKGCRVAHLGDALQNTDRNFEIDSLDCRKDAECVVGKYGIHGSRRGLCTLPGHQFSDDLTGGRSVPIARLNNLEALTGFVECGWVD